MKLVLCCCTMQSFINLPVQFGHWSPENMNGLIHVVFGLTKQGNDTYVLFPVVRPVSARDDICSPLEFRVDYWWAGIAQFDTVTGYMQYGRQRGRSSSPSRGRIFLFSASSIPALGPTQPPIQWVQWVQRLRIRESVHPLPYPFMP
jgi:hypothetical protein